MKEGRQDLFNFIMNNLEHILPDTITKCDFYWKERGFKSSTEVWDKAAAINHIYAAVSAPNEKEESLKTESSIELLKNTLNDGITLDLGCGYGRIAKYLLPVRKLDGYVGVDSSVTMLNIFFDRYKNNEREKETPLMLVNGNIDKILLKDSTVDNVIVSAVFLHNHKVTTKKAISELFRVMKPSAKLFIISSFPNVYSLKGLQGTSYLALLRILGREFKNGPVRYFSKNDVKHLFDGFADVQIFPAGFSVMPNSLVILPSPLNLIYRKTLYQPINSLCEAIIPKSLKRYFCTHYDVIAYR